MHWIRKYRLSWKHHRTILKKKNYFPKLRTLFSSDSPYRDFWENIYKYPDRFKIAGETPENVNKTIQEASGGIRLLADILECFKQIKLHEVQQSNHKDFALQGLHDLMSGFVSAGKLDESRL